AKAGEGGKLYGKITNKEIASILEKQLGFEIDKRNVKPSEDISALGTYKAVVKLAQDAHAEITVEVVLEGTEDKPSKPAKAKEAEEQAAESDELVAAE
ncbi:MAG TPA: 50S ribosomal L9 C-terminal domain-containing protein, partial [Candidatus Obscuribacterales bacterium]